MPDFATMIEGTPRQNSQRVLRGGNWINNARNLRSANRNANSPDNRNHNIGLRLAGALLNSTYRKAKLKAGGSINQRCFLFSGYLYYSRQQNQDPQRVSRQVAESLLLGRLLVSHGSCHVY